jgi:hypothetical protein
MGSVKTVPGNSKKQPKYMYYHALIGFYYRLSTEKDIQAYERKCQSKRIVTDKGHETYYLPRLALFGSRLLPL